MRISDIGMQQILLQGFQNAQDAAQTRQIQLASGDKYQTFGEYGADALRLVSADSVVARAGAFENAASVALTRLETQSASLERISDAVEQSRAGFIRSLAVGNAEQLLPDLEIAAQRIITALNVEFGGVFVFGGTDGAQRPVNANTLADIAAAGTIDALFNEGERTRLAVEEGVSVDGGALASEIARDIVVELGEIANAEATLGPFQGELTSAQRDFLLEKSARFAALADSLFQEQGLSAVAQGQASDALTRNRNARDLAEIVAVQIEDVDIAEALSALSQDQLAIQASARALADASQLSLLNFI